MTRAVRPGPAFHLGQLLHAPAGSLNDLFVRGAIEQLAEEVELPGPSDREDIRTPVTQLYARLVPWTGLVIVYQVEPHQVTLHIRRPATW
ncbi:MAG: hypothetical protein ABI193_17325 [Minicystis sp.]